jgi:hypothetical protein
MIYRWSRSQIYGGYAVSMGGYSQLGGRNMCRPRWSA